MQTELNSTIHVAGKSALQLKGLAHNITGDLRRIELFHNDKKQLPKWFLDYNWGVKLSITKTAKCGDYQKFLSNISLKEISINVSSPELAIMEMLLKVRDKESYSEANLIMEGLLTLRPKILGKLLIECKSVKTKRLFLHLAEKHNHAWFRRLDLSKVDLGSGKRQIVTNGRLDSKYLITVPSA